MEQQFKELLKIHQKIKELKKQRENRMIELNIEVWRYIDDYDKYAVSSFGNIKNVKTGKIMKQSVNTNGYYNLTLWKNKKQFCARTHRLVALAFMDNPLNKPCVDHIDGNKLNNNVKNFRWATKQENNRNQKLTDKNTSGVKGVYYDKSRSKWCARYSLNNKTVSLGRYNTLEEAKIVRQNAVNILFGEYINACEKS
jgi:hypothetical protein